MMTLPYEILLNIFDQLTSKDVYQCQRVCRNWRKPGQKAIFTHPIIRKKEYFELFEKILAQSPALGARVKHLSLEFGCYFCFKQSNLPKLTPNLESLYAEEPSTDFWTSFKDVFDRGEWPHLVSLPNFDENIPRSSKPYEIYYDLVYPRRGKMKKLNIYISYPHRNDENSIMGYPFWLKMIKEFPQVEALRIDINDHRDITDYHDFIEACPNIKKIKLKIDRHHVPRSQYTKRHYFNSLVPNTTITLLEVQHSFLRKPDLTYIMKKFKGLERLYIMYEDKEYYMFDSLLHKELSAKTRDQFYRMTSKLDWFEDMNYYDC